MPSNDEPGDALTKRRHERQSFASLLRIGSHSVKRHVLYFILGVLVMAMLMLAYQRTLERRQHQGNNIGSGGTSAAMHDRAPRYLPSSSAGDGMRIL
jgi:hypothetical protein